METLTKLYLDTSVPSAFYDGGKQERKELTQEFWKKLEKYEVYISTLVIDELNQVKDKILREKLLRLVKRYEKLKSNKKSENLADEYIKEGIISEKFRNDAVHIAIAVVNNINFLISWNFKHLVNIKTRQMVNLVNLKKGFKTIEIIAPPEI